MIENECTPCYFVDLNTGIVLENGQIKKSIENIELCIWFVWNIHRIKLDGLRTQKVMDTG